MLSRRSLGRDVDCIIVSYCGAKSLCNLIALKKSHAYDKDEDILDPVWKVLIQKRWRVRGNVLRAVGATTWRVAYQIMSFRHKIPRGIYTEKHNTVFGSTYSAGCESWVLIGHRSNTSLRRTSAQNDLNNNFIELRVCVQNVYNGMISIPLNNHGFEVVCRTEDDQTQQKMFINNVCNLALNGQRKEVSIEDDFDVKLGPLESVVISVRVCCPLDMEFETDFLARADHVCIKFNICKPYFPFTTKRAVTMKARFVDEDTVWESYVELPGGVILLRSDCGQDGLLV